MNKTKDSSSAFHQPQHVAFCPKARHKMQRRMVMQKSCSINGFDLYALPSERFYFMHSFVVLFLFSTIIPKDAFPCKTPSPAEHAAIKGGLVK